MRLVAALLCLACSHPHAGGPPPPQPRGGPAVPTDVRRTVESLLGPSATIGSDLEGGVTTYEAVAQTRLELELAASGALQKTEVVVPVQALPSAVAHAITGKIDDAEVVVTPTGVVFEVEVANTEYIVDPSGKILSRKLEVDDNDKD